MKGTLYSLEGKVVKEIDLPNFFEESLRPDIIKRAVLSEESKTYQPKGNYRFAGLETSARYRGREGDYGSISNRGISRRAREVLPKGRFGKVKRIPGSVKGRRAHPPKPEKKIAEEINKKEYKKALKSALAFTADRKTVCRRMHVDIEMPLPIVIENSLEKITKTKDVVNVLKALNMGPLLEKAKKNGSKGPLIIVSGEEGKPKAALNIPGVDVVSAKSLMVRHLAPGASPGRIAIFTEKALEVLNERFAKVEVK